MMSLKSKRELLEAIRPRYLKAGKVEKQKMLDEFTCATGYLGLQLLEYLLLSCKHLRNLLVLALVFVGNLLLPCLNYFFVIRPKLHWLFPRRNHYHNQ